MTQRDTIYQTPIDRIGDFAFDDNVADVFPDMIERSVPGYSTIIAMTGVLAGRYSQNHSHCYDLGSSLGASTFSMAQQIEHNDCTIIAIDNSAAMVERCTDLLTQQTFTPDIELRCENIEDTTIENASVAVMNFSLQFIPVAQRQAIINTIYNNLNPGGILVLSEKIAFDDPHLQQLNTELHHEFKKGNGYSELEISQKRTALENVLIAETLPTHAERLRAAGFSSYDVWFQCFNFMSLVAIK